MEMCISLLSVAMKTKTKAKQSKKRQLKATSRGKGLFQFIGYDTMGWGPRQEPQAEAVEGCCLLSCSHAWVPIQSAFLYNRDCLLRDGTSTNQQSRKYPHRQAQRPVSQGKFCKWRSLFFKVSYHKRQMPGVATFFFHFYWVFIYFVSVFVCVCLLRTWLPWVTVGYTLIFSIVNWNYYTLKMYWYT